MQLYLFDDEGWLYASVSDVASDVDAEQLVRSTSFQDSWLTRWVLVDVNERAIWERKGEGGFPTLINVSQDYRGRWQNANRHLPFLSLV